MIMTRKPKEIRRWLRSNLWYREFLRHAWYGRTSVRSALAVIGGYCGIDTMNVAFKWSTTLKGQSFWLGKNMDFQNWYQHGKD